MYEITPHGSKQTVYGNTSFARTYTGCGSTTESRRYFPWSRVSRAGAQTCRDEALLCLDEQASSQQTSAETVQSSEEVVLGSRSQSRKWPPRWSREQLAAGNVGSAGQGLAATTVFVQTNGKVSCVNFWRDGTACLLLFCYVYCTWYSTAVVLAFVRWNDVLVYNFPCINVTCWWIAVL